MRRYALLALLSVLLLLGCKEETAGTMSYRVITRITSPDGCCVAEVHEWKMNEKKGTGLSLDFTEYGGGFSAVSFPGVDLNLKLRWIDSESLEILYPKNVPFYGTRATSTQGTTIIENIEYYKRTIKLRLVPVSKDNDA